MSPLYEGKMDVDSDTPSDVAISTELPIGSSETKVRRKRGNPGSPPRDGASPSANIADAAKPQRRRRTMKEPAPICGASAVAPIDSDSNAGIGGEDQALRDTHMEAVLSAPIEPAATPVRKRRASLAPTPRAVAPGVSPIGQAETPVRKRGGTGRPTPNPIAPPASNIQIGHSSDAVSGGEVHHPPGTQLVCDLSANIAQTTKELVRLQRLRVMCIEKVNADDRRTDDLVSLLLGNDDTAKKGEIKAAINRAKTLREAVETQFALTEKVMKGGKPLTKQELDRFEKAAKVEQDMVERYPDAAAYISFIQGNFTSRRTWDQKRDEAEAAMKKLAQTLPVYQFTKRVRGFGELALAVVYAEARTPIEEYRTVSGLWSRMGLAVWKDGERNHAGHNAEAVANNRRSDKKLPIYAAPRRAQVWSFFSDSMTRLQWCGARDEDGKNAAASGKPVVTPGYPLGPYGAVYQRRLERTKPKIAETAHLPDMVDGHLNPKKWTPKHCQSDAKRIMTKAVLRDLWRVAHGMEPREAQFDAA